MIIFGYVTKDVNGIMSLYKDVPVRMDNGWFGPFICTVSAKFWNKEMEEMTVESAPLKIAFAVTKAEILP